MILPLLQTSSQALLLLSLPPPRPRRGLEIGVGTGRFAVPLGFRYEPDPVREGYGAGSFIAIRAEKRRSARNWPLR